VSGIDIMQIKAGMASLASLKLIFETAVTMIKPTTNNAGAVAKLGMARKMGAKKIAETNRPAAVMAVRPVRAPTATPAALSTKVVVVEVPRTAPTEVAMASAERALEARGRVPSLPMNPPLSDTPISVPSVSKKSTKKKANRTMKKSIDLSSENPCETTTPFSE
jgi:hypothetical protein